MSLIKAQCVNCGGDNLSVRDDVATCGRCGDETTLIRVHLSDIFIMHNDVFRCLCSECEIQTQLCIDSFRGELKPNTAYCRCCKTVNQNDEIQRLATQVYHLMQVNG